MPIHDTRRANFIDYATVVYCRTCGYTLNHLPPGDCPECGQAFDPEDLRTVSLRRPSFARALVDAVIRYSRWVVWVLAVLFCLFGAIAGLAVFIQGVTGNM